MRGERAMTMMMSNSNTSEHQTDLLEIQTQTRDPISQQATAAAIANSNNQITSCKQEQQQSFLCHSCNRPINDRYIMKLFSESSSSASASSNSNNQLNLANGNTNNTPQQPAPLIDENCLLYHENCLRCAICECLLDKTCFVHEAKLLCPHHYYSVSQQRLELRTQQGAGTKYCAFKCIACCLPIRPLELVMRVNANCSVYHLACFTCFLCARQLKRGDSYLILENGRVLCAQHHPPPPSNEAHNRQLKQTTSEQHQSQQEELDADELDERSSSGSPDATDPLAQQHLDSSTNYTQMDVSGQKCLSTSEELLKGGSECGDDLVDALGSRLDQTANKQALQRQRIRHTDENLLATGKRKRRRKGRGVQAPLSVQGGKRLACGRNPVGESILNGSGNATGGAHNPYQNRIGLPGGLPVHLSQMGLEGGDGQQQAQLQQLQPNSKSLSSSASTVSNSSNHSSNSSNSSSQHSSLSPNSGGAGHAHWSCTQASGHQQQQQQQQQHPERGSGVAGQHSASGTHKPTRVRTVLNEKQLQTLRDCYAHNPRPDALMKEHLVEVTGLSARVIRVWFQNKRCKDKKKSILYKQMQQHEKEGRQFAGLTLMRGLPMVAASPVQYDDQSTLSSTPGAQNPPGPPPQNAQPPGTAEPASPQQYNSNSSSSNNNNNNNPVQSQPVQSPSSGAPLEVHAYQPPWKSLAEYAQQQPADRQPLEAAASPRYQQLMNQVHGYATSGSDELQEQQHFVNPHHHHHHQQQQQQQPPSAGYSTSSHHLHHLQPHQPQQSHLTQQPPQIQPLAHLHQFQQQQQ